MNKLQDIQRHYAPAPVWPSIASALDESGLYQRPIDPDTLAALDHFHAGGFAATVEFARWAGLKRNVCALDIGAGLGGPARFLAKHYGCDVTGIDTTVDYVEAANCLTRLCAMGDRVRILEADALHPPFPDCTFELVFMQHVAMNIEDRQGLYRQVTRLLEPGGEFLTYDIVRTSLNASIPYPMPWADGPDSSFLCTFDQTLLMIEDSGLRIIDSRDVSKDALIWFGTPRVSPLNLGRFLKPTFAKAVANLRDAIASGTISPVMVRARRPPSSG
jgi:sarcosine/dimethylglycine N-methyltransferase